MMDHAWVWSLAALAGGYLIGSTPFAYLLGRAKGVDIRTVGSGNVGATNLGRAVGRRWGYLCFALDVAKGLVPVLAVGLALGSAGRVPSPAQQAVWLAAGLGTILGHVLTFWLGFRGGKGVATSLGVVLGMYPYLTWAGLAALGVWIVVVWASRYVSLASLAAAASFLPWMALFHGADLAALWPMVTFAGAMVVLIVLKHRSNIRRLLDGTENKVTRRSRPKPAAQS
jgi:glycerol-3-phosphate acyltransferase PlsY